MQQSPAASGLELAICYWKTVRQFVLESYGISLSCSSCLNWLHRLAICFQAAQEAFDQGRREETGGIRGGVCRSR